jgi:site-specific DNA-cytosine methylase
VDVTLSEPLAILELFCGIGGCAAAVEGCARIAAAVDQNRRALATYEHNFEHLTLPRTVESAPRELFAAADLWWLSPPCQPYTRRGAGRDLADPRAASFPVLLKRIREHRPRYLALENVPPFARSQARSVLVDTLVSAGYAMQEHVLCPTELGWPTRRRRYYLVAGRDELLAWAMPARDDGAALPPGEFPRLEFPLAELLDEADAVDQPGRFAGLWVPSDLLARYVGALHIVSAEDTQAATSCFTSAYGRSMARSGSYLRCAHGVRRFSPTEILRLLGFPPTYSLPALASAAEADRQRSLRQAWALVGNSLSVPAVRWVLSCVPELHEALKKGGVECGRAR